MQTRQTGHLTMLDPVVAALRKHGIKSTTRVSRLHTGRWSRFCVRAELGLLVSHSHKGYAGSLDAFTGTRRVRYGADYRQNLGAHPFPKGGSVSFFSMFCKPTPFRGH
jgi:hypothetical protein